VNDYETQMKLDNARLTEQRDALADALEAVLEFYWLEYSEAMDRARLALKAVRPESSIDAPRGPAQAVNNPEANAAIAPMTIGAIQQATVVRFVDHHRAPHHEATTLTTRI